MAEIPASSLESRVVENSEGLGRGSLGMGTSTAPGVPSGIVKSNVATRPSPTPGSSLVSRVAGMMGVNTKPPASLLDGDSNLLHLGYFHFMLFGNPSTLKTSTAAKFMGPENTRIIVTRRAEQMIPLAGKGYKFKVAADAEALRYVLLYPEKVWPEWAALPDRTLIIDDATEGVNMLVDDHKFYYDEKSGETKEVKDPRRAYKQAGDELHDYFKINLGKRQHVGIIAVERGYEIEGTIDYRIEPDVPNKIAKLLETELEFVFYMEDGEQGKMLTKTKTVTRTSSEKNKATGRPDMWREITFAKSKLPMQFANALLPQEDKDLAKVWSKVQAALKGEIPAPVKK